MNPFNVALAPIVALLLFIYYRDRYHSEPVKLLVKLFVFGFLVTIAISFVESLLKFLYSFFSGHELALENITVGSLSNIDVLFISFIIAGFTEEFFKYLIVKSSAYNDINFDEKLDGIVYCVFVSLGFAACENILYVFGAMDYYISMGIIRAFTAVPAHMLFGVIMGYYLSMAKFSISYRDERKYLVRALVYPILAHGLYDYVAITNETSESLLIRLGFLLLFIILMICLWIYGLTRIQKYANEAKENI